MAWTWPLRRRVTYAPLTGELRHDDRLRRSLLFLCYLCAVSYFYRFAHELAATRLKEAGEAMLAAQVAAMSPATDATCIDGVRV